ncbi:MAG TPA: phytanoyl-CoA dioxygenase family protein [Noviherbaspirillum sp.]|nr:phytanoyl-CoA dioxygenase family protein [Noviherbaspirillum sp.]
MPDIAAIDDARQAYEAQGFAVVRQWLDRHAIEALEGEADRILAQWMTANHAHYVAERLVNMHSLTDVRYFSDAGQRIRFFELVASERLTSLVDGMFGGGIYFHNTQLFFNPHENSRLPYWHRDLQYSPIEDEAQAREQRNMLSLHVRIPLLPERGLEVIPGTHRRWDSELEADVRRERNGRANSDALPGAKLISAEPGDVIIFDAQMIHRGNYALNPERKALDLCVGRAHPIILRYLDASVLPADDHLDRIRNNAWYQRALQLVPEISGER